MLLRYPSQRRWENSTKFASNTNFRFDNRKCVKSVKFVKISSLAGGRELFLDTDVVDGNSPLLLSKDVMKKNTDTN